MKKYLNTEIIFICLLVGGFFLLTSYVGDESNTEDMKAYFFSETKGQVLLEGKPVKGALVTRSYLLDETESEQTYTDEQGRFSFPAIKSIHWRQWSFMPFRITQGITISHDNTLYEAYGYERTNWEKNSEAEGKPLNLLCELTNEIKAIPLKSGGKRVGLCRLSN